MEKAIQTQAGIIITAKKTLIRAGNFDDSVGLYILTVPMVIIGLDAPESFIINPNTKEVEAIQVIE